MRSLAHQWARQQLENDMSSGAELAKLNRLKAEQTAANAKLKKAKTEFAGKLGTDLIKALGDEKAVKLVDAIASVERDAIPGNFVERISEELGIASAKTIPNGTSTDSASPFPSVSQNS
ncbi:MAG: hypothetical protein AAF720_12790 [Pseudomonadota bacterium]